jgi:hypothetical protein
MIFPQSNYTSVFISFISLSLSLSLLWLEGFNVDETPMEGKKKKNEKGNLVLE